MIGSFVRILARAFFLLVIMSLSALAQSSQSLRVAGALARVEGATLVVKPRDGSEARVSLTEKALVFGVVKASPADLKPGVFAGVGAMPQADGSQRAIQVTIFAEEQRGQNEGYRPWSRLPNSTMTNATVDTIITNVNGQTMTVKYKDGEQKIIVPPDATILAYVASDRSEIKPGANISFGNVAQRPDGTFEATRVYIGRGGVVPQ
jgi:hypothetical protein